MTKGAAAQMMIENADEANEAMKSIRDAVGSAAKQLHDWLESMSTVQAYALALSGCSIVVSIRFDEMDEQPVQFLWGNPKSVRNNIFEMVEAATQAKEHSVEEYDEKRA